MKKSLRKRESTKSPNAGETNVPVPVREVRSTGRAKDELPSADAPGFGAEGDRSPVLERQQRHGNQAVQRLLNERERPPFRVARPDDACEREADSVAKTVIRMSNFAAEASDEPLGRVSPGRSQTCSSCPAELARDGSDSKASSADAVSAPQIEALRQGGRPLSPSARSFFEPRFGRSFGDVRVHTGARADDAARTLNARAFTVGRHLVFSRGAYEPRSDSGKALLAHELAHTVQQEGSTRPLVQRISYGRGSPPSFTPEGGEPLDVIPVPDEERARMDDVIEQIREVAENPEGYPQCHQFFADNCPSGSESALADAFHAASLWRIRGRTGNALAWGKVSGTDIAYTQAGWDTSDRNLARTLVHELMHNCGIHGDEHYLADVAGLYCIGPVHRLSVPVVPRLGMTLDPQSFVMMYTYRAVLEEWSSGRVQLTAGGDINLVGAGSAIAGSETPAEFGSATVGVRGRISTLSMGYPTEVEHPLWGGERFGGLVGGVDVGLGAGQFLLRPPAPGEGPSTRVGPSMVLEVSGGAEFYIPVGVNAHPVTLEAAWRLAQPLNPQAERIQTVLLGASMAF